MMGKKSKRLYDRMQHGIQQKQDSVDRLVSKREEAENKEKSATKRKRGEAASEAPAGKKSKVAAKKK